MGGEFGELERALREYGRSVRDYVRAEQRVLDELPPARRRFSPLRLAAVLVLALTLPAIWVGSAAAGLRVGSQTPSAAYVGSTQVWSPSGGGGGGTGGT